MRVLVRYAGVSLALVALCAGAARADAATTTIGSASEIRSGMLPSPIAEGGFTVQVAEASGSYAVPAGYDAITAWSHSTGSVTGSLTFKVYRPTGAPQEFLVVGSDTQQVTAGVVHTFAVQIPVRPGDRIGLSSDDVQLAYETNELADRIGFFGADLPVGATRATDGVPFPDNKLDVAATLQSAPDPAAPPSPPPPGTEPAAPGAGVAYTLAPPSLSRLVVAPRAFRAARRGPSAGAAKRGRYGAKVSYRTAAGVRVRFTVRQARSGRRTGRGTTARCVAPTARNRSAARCTRHLPLPGSFAQTARGTGDSFLFTGRLRGRALRRGAYQLVATPSANAITGTPVVRGFRITG